MTSFLILVQGFKGKKIDKVFIRESLDFQYNIKCRGKRRLLTAKDY